MWLSAKPEGMADASGLAARTGFAINIPTAHATQHQRTSSPISNGMDEQQNALDNGTGQQGVSVGHFGEVCWAR